MDPIRLMYQRRNADWKSKLRRYKAPSNQHIRASELGKCKRMTYYRLAGYIPDRTYPGTLMDYSQDGDLHHDAVREAMLAGGLKITGFTRTKDGHQETESHLLPFTHNGETFTITVRLDGLIRIGNVVHVLEIKSLNQWKLNGLLNEWEEAGNDAALLAYIDEHRKDILFQTHAEMVAVKKKRAYVVFKDRSNCHIGLHSRKNPERIIGGPIIQFREDIWARVLNRCAAIALALRMDVPPQQLSASSTDCKYCDYLHLCHGADRRRKAGINPAMLHSVLGSVVHVDDL